MSRHTAGSLAIAGVALSWGFISLIVRELEELPEQVVVFYRVGLSAAAIAAVLVLIRRTELMRMPPRPVLSLGVLLALHWVLFFAAINETSVASAVLVTYTAPVFMAMLSPVILAERLTRVTIGALAVSLAGTALIALASGEGGGEVTAHGVALALAAAVTMAFLIVLLKRFGAGTDPVTVVFYESLVATLVLLPFGIFESYDVSASDAAYLAILGVVLSGVVGVIYVAALRNVAATTAGILAYMEPVSAALLAALLLDEALTAGVIVGGIAIVAAGVVLVLRAPEPSPVAIEEPVAVGRTG
jgi:drug/metabolite transporter, DME family